MSTNLSKLHREDLLNKIQQIRTFIASAEQDENAHNLLSYLDELVKEVKGKKYGLVFEEHREQIDEMLDSHLPVFSEQTDLFIDNDGEMNFLIEGDNLAALHLLEKTHKGKIDVIYIDPPYNTGNKDFVYDDVFVDTNDTFRHSKWLSFMEKRLAIAKNLLSENGVIFISIDDNEQAQVKLMCDSVLGADNFIAQIIWERAFAPVNLKKHFSESHDYIICFAKNLQKAICNGLPRSQENDNRYSNPDNDARGVWTSSDMTVGPAIPEKIYKITTPNGTELTPVSGRCWLFTKERYQEMLADNRIWFGANGGNMPRVKKFLSEVKQGVTPMTIWKYTEVGHSQDATKELKAVFDGESKFTYPKSVRLIQRIAGLYGDKNSTILDFFAGSGTTGHAVMKLNAEDGGQRKFILCTNNENNICRDVTYERIKRVIDKENYKASLKYFKVDFVPISEKLYYEYADELLKHVKELVELENAINFDGNDEIAIILTEEELDKFTKKIPKTCKTIYLGHDVLPSETQEKLFKKNGITLNIIPNYYYSDLEG
ncbi:MAG: site-specific DNA-methyltransferase [Paludibacteraceae bacterium]|nr:site-specific DNA-methyltransferase [Paludibacteraceae bacterium]